MSRRILIVNKFLYQRGGDCIVALSTRDLLRERGYETAIWGMEYGENEKSEYDHTFAAEVRFNGNASDKITAGLRTMGFAGVRKSFGKVLKEFRPDTVHFHNIHSYLSPTIVKMAHEYGARTLWTMHDYKLACPSYLCTRDGKPCTECLNNPSAVIKYKCMKGSTAASIIAYLEACKWSISKLSQYTDIFICPSRFMAEMMIKAGVPQHKTIVLHNFSRLQTTDETAQTEDYYAYFGRLSTEKGVETLLKAASDLPYKLKVFGEGPSEKQLKDKYGRYRQIEFYGQADAHTVTRTMASARLTVMPSECYENNPLSVIESLCAGTPVAGSRTGGIPELILPGDGILFEPSNTEELKKAVETIYASSNTDRKAIMERARERFSPDKYAEVLECLIQR